MPVVAERVLSVLPLPEVVETSLSTSALLPTVIPWLWPGSVTLCVCAPAELVVALKLCVWLGKLALAMVRLFVPPVLSSLLAPAPMMNLSVRFGVPDDPSHKAQPVGIADV